MSLHRRLEKDIKNLIRSSFIVDNINDSKYYYTVIIRGPSDSIYRRGAWKVKPDLFNNYPCNPPKLYFQTRIFHPNIEDGDDKNGSVCLDVLQGKWNPSSDLVNVFKYFIPQLLHIPEASSPLNADAARLKKKNEAAYKEKVKEFCMVYARPEFLGLDPYEGTSDDDGEDPFVAV